MITPLEVPLSVSTRPISAPAVRAVGLTLLCIAALLLCVLICHPVAEGGVDDDWAYIWSARALAQTHHIHYQGWATTMLGWQLYIGALFIKIFGSGAV